jgi:hypothetical protein
MSLNKWSKELNIKGSIVLCMILGLIIGIALGIGPLGMVFGAAFSEGLTHIRSR